MEMMMEHLANGLWISLLLSMPAVLTAAAVGLDIGILQAVTQVQEQTISAAPKLMAVFMLIILGSGLMMTQMVNYTRESFHIAFNEIPNSELHILPPNHTHAALNVGTQASGKVKQYFQNNSHALEDIDRFQGKGLRLKAKPTHVKPTLGEEMAIQRAQLAAPNE